MERIEQNKEKTAIITDDKSFTYAELLEYYEYYTDFLTNIPQGSVVAVRGEFDVETIGLMLTLMEKRCIYVPISKAVVDVNYYQKTSRTEFFIDMDEKNLVTLQEKSQHPLYEKLRQIKHPGIVFFFLRYDWKTESSST